MVTGSPSIATIPEALDDAVEQYGNDPFVHHHDRTLSFESLDRRSDELAAGLRSNDIGPGDTVGLLLYNSPEYVAVYFAIAKIGATIVPIDTRFEGATLRSVLETAAVEMIVVDASTRHQYESIRDGVSVQDEYVVHDGAGHQGYDPLETLRMDAVEGVRPAITGDETASITFVQRDPANPPNGVVLPQYSYVNTGREIAETLFEFSRSDRLYTTLPLYSIFTFQVGIMAALRAGAQITIDDPFDPTVFWDRVRTHDASILLYLGRMLSVLNTQKTDDYYENPAATVIGHGFSFGTDESLIREFEERFAVTVFEGYGTTETGTIATFNGPADRRIGSSGRAVSSAEVTIVDENDWEVPRGESGEIVVRPTRQHTMFQGYFDDPSRTVEHLENGWIHTGDIGYLDEQGYLHFVANEKNSIYRGKIAGNISSLEIESVIESHPSVHASAVVGVETPDSNEAIKAVVVPEEGESIPPVEISRHCEKQLPWLKVPRYIDVRAALPRAPSGKIRKGDLSEDTSECWDRRGGYELSR